LVVAAPFDANPGRIDPFLLADVKSVFPDRGHHPAIVLTAEVFTKILNELANCGVYYKACAAAGIGVFAVANFRKEDHPEIEFLLRQAKEYYRQKICQAVHNRAIEGWEEEVYYQGSPCGTVRKFSDRLLEMHAKRHIPEYRDHLTTDVNVSGGVLVVHAPTQSKEEFLAAHRKQVESKEVKP
jgi:hypothetical protein